MTVENYTESMTGVRSQARRVWNWKWTVWFCVSAGSAGVVSSYLIDVWGRLAAWAVLTAALALPIASYRRFAKQERRSTLGPS